MFNHGTSKMCMTDVNIQLVLQLFTQTGKSFSRPTVLLKPLTNTTKVQNINYIKNCCQQTRQLSHGKIYVEYTDYSSSIIMTYTVYTVIHKTLPLVFPA